MDDTNKDQKNLFVAAILRIAVLVALVLFFALGFHLGRKSAPAPEVAAGAQCAAIAPSTTEERNAVWTVLNGASAPDRSPAGAMAAVIQALVGPDSSRSLRDGISIFANKMVFSFAEAQHKEFSDTLSGNDRTAAADVLIKLFRADAHTASIAVDCLSDRSRMRLFFEGKPIPLE